MLVFIGEYVSIPFFCQERTDATLNPLRSGHPPSLSPLSSTAVSAPNTSFPEVPMALGTPPPLLDPLSEHSTAGGFADETADGFLPILLSLFPTSFLRFAMLCVG
jgi:hypothetical protein